MWLTIRSGEDAGTTVEATGEEFVVGREDGCDLVVRDEKASRRHCALEALPDGRAILTDLGSSNGTFVDGQQIAQPTLLNGGEEIRVGATLITVSTAPGAAPGTPTTVEPVHAEPSSPAPPAAFPPGAPVPPSRPSASPTPSRVERMLLRRSVRRAQILAGVAGAGVLVAVAVVLLFVTGVFGGGEKQPSIPEIVAAVTPSTVLVNAIVGDQVVGGGTGWVLDAAQGLIVTNQHVVNAGSTFTIGVGTDERPAEVVGSAPCEDLAVLKVDDTTGLVTLPLGSQSELEQGDAVVALGYPANAALGADLAATTGVVSVVQTQFKLDSLDVPRYPNVIQTDAAINPGNSGGPLVDLQKQLVGVNSAGITLLGGRTIQGQGYAIGVDRVKEITAGLRTGKSIGWTGMGFDYPVDPASLTDLGLPADTPGLVVAHVAKGSPAETAGFGQFPVLVLAINGTAVDNTLPSYCRAVRGIESGDTATFTVVAQGDTQTQDIDVEFR
jgi:S1-C subfamily serine protease